MSEQAREAERRLIQEHPPEGRHPITREDTIILIRMMHRFVQLCEHGSGCAECRELYRLERKLTELYKEKT
ncbi:hypothetical protein LCGC14_1401700 [marine sediment metagenome]|uniref:Uncharacterized protein n=1 Tax=marine sediment metagenome TaxID=412755 RepID=A0A0F9KHX1_9ZZZZ